MGYAERIYMLSMPYWVNRSAQAFPIPNLHVQSSKDATVTTISNDGIPKI